ncbi:MAG TPA: type III polyketide synthase [Phycisphaerales bacterium]|nr:type III polyketide synthase [Phycisphaerales bacterium]
MSGAPAIVSLACVSPPHRAGQADSLRFAVEAGGLGAESARFAEVIYRRSGVAQRGSCLLTGGADESGRMARAFLADGSDGPTTGERMTRYADEAVRLAERAAREALDRAGGAAGITHTVTVSCTGFVAPGIDHALIERLGLARTVRRLHVGYMGCHGAVNGLAAARAIVLSEPGARVLLVCVELCSLHFQSGERPDQIVANALFADGAAAAVIAAHGDSPVARVAATGGCVFPDSSGAMAWRIGDHGFEMTLAESVPRLIGEHLRPWLSSWLDVQGTSLREMVERGAWAVHPGGPRVLDAVASALGLSEEAMAASRGVLREHGNMSSPTVLFILDRIRRGGAARPTVLLAFGPGLSAEAALVTA